MVIMLEDSRMRQSHMANVNAFIYHRPQIECSTSTLELNIESWSCLSTNPLDM